MAGDQAALPAISWFGARKLARSLQSEVRDLQEECGRLRGQLQELGALSVLELEAKRTQLETDITAQRAQVEAEIAAKRTRFEADIARQQAQLEQDKAKAAETVQSLEQQVEDLRKSLVVTEDLALLQEAGVYEYRHPLTDAVAYQQELARVANNVKAMTKKEDGAVQAAMSWTVNGSAVEGRAMVRDFSKLMLRAFNAEADNLVRGLKPHKLQAAIDRLNKVATTIERLGRRMQIRISAPYLNLRILELSLTADFLQKQAEEKEAERQERERLREERKVQQEMERERARLEKERQHYENALQALVKKGDDSGAERLRAQLSDVDRAIADVDYRAANVRAGYVYVISNIGSFGEKMVKVGMTRRLDPLERIRELSDASVPFNFDVHAVFFSKDAVGIEQSMHERLAAARVNIVNRRREFFHATPLEAKAHLAELAGELLEFQEIPDALEYRQGLSLRTHVTEPASMVAAAGS